MPWAKFRKLPVVIDAILWDGELETFQRIKAIEGDRQVASHAWESLHPDDQALNIITREGVMRADKGDWVVKGVQGELSPCKPDIFEATYEGAE